eukprot:6180473-Pleurochrysis_carterae.AAC.10
MAPADGLDAGMMLRVVCQVNGCLNVDVQRRRLMLRGAELAENFGNGDGFGLATGERHGSLFLRGPGDGRSIVNEYVDGG